MRLRVMIFVVGLVTAACAISEPPPGGPEDKTAPVVMSVYPEEGTAGVSPDAEIGFEFSEGMKRSRFERFFEFSPTVVIKKVKWKGNTAVVIVDGGLHPDTTYIVKLKTGYADSHGVRGELPYEFAFATSAEIDTGSVSGRVLFRREPSEKAVVKLFVLPQDSTFTPEASRPDRQASSGPDGTFTIKYLPARNAPFLIWGFHDADGNGLFDPEKEAGAALPDTIRLTSAAPRVEDQIIDIVDPREPCVVAGRINNLTGFDSVFVTISLSEVSDTIPPTYIGLADLEGNYSFENVLKGAYMLEAFIDFKRDSLCGDYPCSDDSTRVCREPCAAYSDTLILDPGDKLEGVDFDLEVSGSRED